MTAASFTHITSRLLSLTIAVLAISCSVEEKGKEIDEKPEAFVPSTERSLVPEDVAFDIPVFVYHRFSDSRYPTTSIDTALFREHLSIIKEAGFEAVSYSGLRRRISSADNMENLCMITIDDGYKTVLRGVSILQEFEFGATVFVNTSTVGSGDYMGWEDLVSIQKLGIDIGNHTHTHPFLLDSSDREIALRNELEISQTIFRQELGEAPTVFAYPYGEYDPGMFVALAQKGFAMSFAQNSGVFNERSNIQAIPRFPMNDLYGKVDRFREKLNMHGLRVNYLSDSTNEFVQNPPEITVEVIADIVPGQMQFFIGGRVEQFSFGEGKLRLRSGNKLTNRRTLYTVTAKDRNNQWYWYSHPWFNASIPDQ